MQSSTVRMQNVQDWPPSIVSNFRTERQMVYLMSCGHICSKTNRCMYCPSITQRKMGEEQGCIEVVRPPRLQHFQGPSQLPQTHIFICSLHKPRPLLNYKQDASETSQECLGILRMFAFRKVLKKRY